MQTSNNPSDKNLLDEREQKARIKYYTEGAKAYQDFQWLFAIILILIFIGLIGAFLGLS